MKKHKTMTKEELRSKEKVIKQKIADVPEEHKAFWRRQLKDIQKRLYNNQ